MIFEDIKREKNFLLLLFLLSLLVQTVFFKTFINKDENYFVCTDSKEYSSIATNIFHGFGIKKFDGDLNFRRLPGYPFFLAACYSILGFEDIKKALFVQLGFACIIPMLIFLLSLVFFAKNYFLARISSLVSVFSIGFALYSGMILSDTLFIFLFLVFSIFFFSNIHLFFCPEKNREISVSIIFLSGLLLGLAGMVRPVGHYILICLNIILLFTNLIFVQKVKVALALNLGFFSIASIWLVRNFLLTGFLFFHTLPGIHFLIYTAAYCDMETKNCSYPESRFRLLKKWDEKCKSKKLDDIQSCHLAEELAIKYIKRNPFAFVRHSMIHMFKTCFGLHCSRLLFLDSGAPEYTKKTTMFSKIKRFLVPVVNNKFLLVLIYFEIFLLLILWIGFVGFFLKALYSKRLLCVFFRILPLIFCFISITLAYGCARLRLAIEPFLIILSFSFWQAVFLHRRKMWF